MRVLALPYCHMLSHISRPLLIAKELRARGCEVIFAGEGDKKKFVAQEDFDVLALYEPDPRLLLENIREGRLKFISGDNIDAMVESDLALFEQVKPDLVLSDFRMSAPISTQIAGIKHAAIVNASSTEYRAIPYAPLFAWLPRLLRQKPVPGKLLDALNLNVEMLVFDNVMRVFKKLTKKYRLGNSVTATNCLAGIDLTLLADIPEYIPSRNLPKNYHYIGPLTWQSELPPPRWWPPSGDAKPLIYITMGTTGIEDAFSIIYDLFRQSDMAAIVTTGAQIGNLESLKGRIYVEPFINGDLVMEACDLVLCHGGNGTIYQAIKHCKPIVGIPTLADQAYNMRMVERLGIGHSLPSWKDVEKNPAALYRLVETTLKQQSIQTNLVKLAKTLSTYNSPKIAADLIMRKQNE